MVGRYRGERTWASDWAVNLSTLECRCFTASLQWHRVSIGLNQMKSAMELQLEKVEINLGTLTEINTSNKSHPWHVFLIQWQFCAASCIFNDEYCEIRYRMYVDIRTTSTHVLHKRVIFFIICIKRERDDRIWSLQLSDGRRGVHCQLSKTTWLCKQLLRLVT